MTRKFTKAVVSCAAIFAAAMPAFAQDTTSEGHGQEDYLNTAVQYAYSWDSDNDFIIGYGSDSGDRHQFRGEHQQTWKYGTLYAFGDVINSGSNLGGERDFGFLCCGDGKDTEWFGLINGTISLARVLDKPLNLGPIKDIGLEGRVERGSFFGYEGAAIGASVDLDVPGFKEKGEYIRLHYWRRSNKDEFVSSPNDAGGAASESYADHNFWGATLRNDFEIGGQKVQHQTFIRHQQNTKGDADELERFNRWYIENEAFVYVTDRISLGVRSEYFQDSGGISFGGKKSDWRPMVAIKVDLFNR